jgi:hypothetical protein
MQPPIHWPACGWELQGQRIYRDWREHARNACPGRNMHTLRHKLSASHKLHSIKSKKEMPMRVSREPAQDRPFMFLELTPTSAFASSSRISLTAFCSGMIRLSPLAEVSNQTNTLTAAVKCCIAALMSPCSRAPKQMSSLAMLPAVESL